MAGQDKASATGQARMSHSPPLELDDESALLAKEGERLLRRFLALAALALLSSFAYQMVNGLRGWSLLAFALFALVVSASYLYVRAGRIRLGVVVLSWGAWVVVTIASVTLAGIHTPALFYYPVFIVLTGWLQGRRPAYLMGGATVLVLLFLVFGVEFGWLEASLRRTPKEMLFAFVPAALLGAVLSGALSEHDKRQKATERRLSLTVQARLDDLQRSEEAVRALNSELEQRVAQRTAELSARSEELAASLGQLKRTQTELVEAEKLAALGALVAGVAHELNTPLGNALTAVTTLHGRIDELHDQSARGEMRRADFAAFVSDGTALTLLATRACERAAHLVASFKQVAADRTAEQRHEFDLRQLVHDLIATLRPTLDPARWQIHLDIPAGIRCDSYPGPLVQILGQLIQNAERHAFAGHQNGTVHIKATNDEGQITLLVVDNGHGMPATTLSRIFDPFFTTRLGQGGSGLGLAISRNIATGMLCGSLRAESEPGRGTSFTLSFPALAPL
jgi:signal transduction histidine kinase